MENWCGGEETVGAGRHARRLEARALSVRALPDWIKRSRMGTQLRDRSWWVNRAIPQLAINCKTAWTLGANGGELIRWAELSRNGRANRSGIGGGFLRSE